MIKKTLLLVATSLTLTTFAAQAQTTTILTEPFNYADGPLVGAVGSPAGNPASPWTTTSGTAGQVDVTGGLVNITGTETEDVATPIGGQVYATGVLSATLAVSFSVLPSGVGTYFTHFKDATTSGFRGRVFATTLNAAAGSFRLAIADTTGTLTAANAVTVPLDLSLNTAYTLTLSLDVASGRSSLAINGGTPVAATDTTTPLAISNYALRQSTNEGTLTADNLVVTFNPVPEPGTYVCLLAGAGALALAVRRRRVA